MTSNTCYSVINIIIKKLLWDNNIARIRIWICSDFCSISFGDKIVINAIPELRELRCCEHQ